MKIIVNKEDEGLRLDLFLAKSCASISRTRIQNLVDENFILVNGSSLIKRRYIVKENDVIEIILPEPKPSIVIAEPLPIDIIYEDEHLLAVNKPPFLTVHPYTNKLSGTLVNRLLYHCKILSTVAGPLKPGIVHRLDSETSGVILIAKTDAAHLVLLTRFKDRTIMKYYNAIIHGVIKDDVTIIESPIGRNPNDRTKMSVHSKMSKEAKTSIHVLKRFPAHTFVNVRIYTGRTHQIRVHLSSINRPVVGDKKYGGRNILKMDNLGLKRQALHAHKVILNHPIFQNEICIKAPLPEDMKDALMKIENL
jgi:23S rRNA pseudouridine1911/1915/1917 synthase